MIQTTAFNAEQALTKDTLPVNVDAIIFWHVHDARKAALEITNYRQAIERRSCTTGRRLTSTCGTRLAARPPDGVYL
jgi:regulator of protease activity HflC (stomatin/prohibitin superfamily)